MRLGRWLRIVVVIALGPLVLVAMAWIRSPIRPVAVEAIESRARVGPLAPNDRLQAAEILGRDRIAGAEDVAFGPDGTIYAGTADGSIVRVTGPDAVETVVDTGGRPLGIDWSPDGRLIVADADRGLLAVNAAGIVESLVTAVDGEPLGFPDDVDVAEDGTVYFSDASVYGLGDHMYDLMEGRPHGRLLRYEPTTRRTDVLVDGLYFANGVAVAPQEDFVLVNETYRFRVMRLWLQGPKSGTVDVFVDELPGYPDGISGDGNGHFWVALFTVRNATAEFLGPRPWLKRIIAGLPRFLWPGPQPYGFAIELDETGTVVRSLQDPEGNVVPQVTAAERSGSHLFMGNLNGQGIARVRLEP